MASLPGFVTTHSSSVASHSVGLVTRALVLVRDSSVVGWNRSAALVAAVGLLLHARAPLTPDQRLAGQVLALCSALVHGREISEITRPSLLRHAVRSLRLLQMASALPDTMRYSTVAHANTSEATPTTVCDALSAASVACMRMLSRMDAAEAVSALVTLRTSDEHRRQGWAAAAILPWALQDLGLVEHALSIAVGDLVKGSTHADYDAVAMFGTAAWLLRDGGAQTLQWVVLCVEQLLSQTSQSSRVSWLLTVLFAAHAPDVTVRSLYAVVTVVVFL